MADSDDSVICDNCKRNIPRGNADLHISHCSKNIRLCTLCDDPVPIREFDQHMEDYHKEVDCPKCGERYREGSDDEHKDSCLGEEVQCAYCHLGVARRETSVHEHSCGARTDTCEHCNARVMLRDMDTHVCDHIRFETGHVDRLSTSPYALSPVRGTRNGATNRGRVGATRGAQSNRALNTNLLDVENQLQSLNTNNELDYLDELIATDRFAAMNGSAVDLDAALAAQMAHDQMKGNNATFMPAQAATLDNSYPNQHGSQGMLLPCEFCEAMFPVDTLILHQTGCVENSVLSPERRIPHQLPTMGENEGRIPCEFCCRHFPISVINQHQAGCTPIRRPGPVVQDDRPIRPQTEIPSRSIPSRPTPVPRANWKTPPRKPLVSSSRVSVSNSQNNSLPSLVPAQKQRAPITRQRPTLKTSAPKGKAPTNGLSLNNLDKAAETKPSAPYVMVPKAKRRQTRVNSTSDNTTETWTSPKIVNSATSRINNTRKSGPSLSTRKANNANSSVEKAGPSRLTPDHRDQNLAGGSDKPAISGKSISIQGGSETRNARQRILHKYQRDKTFTVNGKKSDGS